MRTCLSALVLCALTGSAQARTLTSIDVPVTGAAQDAALQLVRTHAADFGGDATAQLVVQRVTSLRRGAAVHVAQRTAAGLPVLNAGVTVMVIDGRMVAASGALQTLTKTSESGRTLSRAEADAALTRALPAARVQNARRAVWAIGKAPARDVWVLNVIAHSPLRLLEVRMDAHTGAVIWTRSNMRHAAGKAYLPNPIAGPVQQVELQGLTTTETLTGEYAAAQTCKRSGGYQQSTMTCEQLAKPDADGNYLYEPEEPSITDPFAEVQAYYHVDTFHRWLAETFEYARPGNTQQIDVLVNYAFETTQGDTHGVYNAFFGDTTGDGKGDLVFGQGQRDYAYDADVVYHEFTHSVVEETSRLGPDLDELGYNMMPLALNESFADIISTMKSGDPNLGEYAGQGAIRVLVGSAKCPDDLIGESHSDGLIWGQALWTIRASLSDTAAFDQAVWAAMVGIDSHATLSEAGALLTKLVQTMAPDALAATKAELTKRGLDDCSRIQELAPGMVRTSYTSSTYGMPGGVGPAPFQYKIDVGERAIEMKVRVAYLYAKWGESPLGLFVRKDKPVDFSGMKPVYDFVLANPGSEIVFKKGDKDHPLVPGSTYYVIPVNTSTREAPYDLSMDILEEAPPIPEPDPDPVTPDPVTPDPNPVTPDPGPSANVDAPPSAGGCAVGASPSMAPLGLVLMLLALRRRRR